MTRSRACIPHRSRFSHMYFATTASTWSIEISPDERHGYRNVTNTPWTNPLKNPTSSRSDGATAPPLARPLSYADANPASCTADPLYGSFCACELDIVIAANAATSRDGILMLSPFMPTLPKVNVPSVTFTKRPLKKLGPQPE